MPKPVLLHKARMIDDLLQYLVKLRDLHIYHEQNRTGILVESERDHPQIELKGYDGEKHYSSLIYAAYFGKNVCIVPYGKPYYDPTLYITRESVTLMADKATSTDTLKDPPLIMLMGRYWDESAGISRSRDAKIVHRMLSTTPTSEVVLRIVDSDYLRIGDDGFRVEKNKFDAGQSVSIDANSTYTLPTGAWYVILGANTKAEIYDDVADAWIEVIPAGGKGLVISDGSNARLNNTGASAETSTIRRVF